MADNNESLGNVSKMIVALEFFGLITVFCLLLCFCYRCYFPVNENGFNSSGSGFRFEGTSTGRELVFRDTVTAPAVMFSKKTGRSEAANNQLDEESSTF